MIQNVSKIASVTTLVFTAVFLLYVTNAFAVLGFGFNISGIKRGQNFTFLSATTTNATSTTDSTQAKGFVIAGAKSVDIFLTHGGAATTSLATSTFSVQVSTDGSTWYNYNKLIPNTTNTNAQSLTRVSSSSIEGATSTLVFALDLIHDSFYSMRCIVLEGGAEGTQGEHTCAAYAEY
jgi:hypothetical protein